jgi:beta-lactamase regulating signal transducer with metallopeptidase domain
MTEVLLRVGASKLALSVVLAVMVWAVQRRWRRPAVTHALWLLVLGVLVVPAVFAVPAVSLPGLASIGRAAGGAGGRGSWGVDALLAAAPVLGLESVKRGLVLAWLAGSMVVLLGSLFRAWRFDHSLRTASTSASADLQTLAAGVARELGLSRTPAVLATRARLSPMVWWMGGPVRVVVPTSVLADVDAGQLRWIVAHELAHVLRRDHWVRWLEWLACVVFWWNPVVWWARRRLREAEELCCDALVLRSLHADPRAYARSLLAVVDALSHEASFRAPALASGVDGGGRVHFIEQRLKMIIGSSVTSKTPRWLRVVLGLGIVAVLPFGLTYCGPDSAETAIVEPDPDAIEVFEVSEVPSPRLTGDLPRSEAAVSEAASEARRRKQELEAMVRKIRSAVRTGDLTPDQAREKLQVLERSVSEGGGTVIRRFEPPTPERIAEEGRKLRAAVAAGGMTQAEARKRLRALREAASTLEAIRERAVGR